MGCWTAWTLCTVFILPVSALPSWLSGWRACDRHEEREWSSNFQTSIEESGLGGQKGLSRLAVDLRSGVLSLPVPHVYAVLGGGDWGPRAVVKALVESVYLAGWNTGAVVVVDMVEAKKVHRDRGIEEAQLWLKDKVASAIVRCPQKATVVFDNVQALQGQDLLLLDPLLLLFDGNKSIMDHGDMKLSGDGTVFLLLLNEDDSEETEGLNGKDRLRHALTFEGRGFTTDAFVGRMDAALVLSSPPPRSPEQQTAIEEAWRIISSEEDSANLPGGIGGAITTALRDAEPRTLQVVGATVAAILATGVAACWALGCFEEAPRQNEDGSRSAPSLWASSDSDSGEGGGGGKGRTAKTARGGGVRHGSSPNEPHVGGASKTPGKKRDMPDEDTRYAMPSRRASSGSSGGGGNTSGSSGNGGRGDTTPRGDEGSEYCSNGSENGSENGGSSDGDTTPDAAAQPRAAVQTPVNLTPTSGNRGPGPTTRSRTRASTGTASIKGTD